MNHSIPDTSRLDRMEALVAAYIETSAKEIAALNKGLQESRQLINSVVETSAKEIAALNKGLQESRQLINSVVETSAKEIAALNKGLQESRQLINSVARTAQANSTEIAQLKRERQATNRQIAQFIRQGEATDRQIAQLGNTVADYIATSRKERSTLFEMIQSLNDSRVEMGETMVSMANSLSQLVDLVQHMTD